MRCKQRPARSVRACFGYNFWTQAAHDAAVAREAALAAEKAALKAGLSGALDAKAELEAQAAAAAGTQQRQQSQACACAARKPAGCRMTARGASCLRSLGQMGAIMHQSSCSLQPVGLFLPVLRT